MFQPQPTTYSSFSTYGINLSPPPPPSSIQSQQPNSLSLDFENFNQLQLQSQQQHQHPIPHQQQQHSHSQANSRSHTHSHTHPRQHSNQLLSQSSTSTHTSPSTTIIAHNPSSSIVVGSQGGQSTATAGRVLGSTLHQFRERHPQPHQHPIFSSVNNSNTTNANSNIAGNQPHNPNPNSLNSPFFQHNQQQYKMEGNAVNDLEAQEALARNFQPTLQGPLVGEKKSSSAITDEYAKADPVYVAKTAALPEKYSHYRPILGDGNCGWRAAGFSYFEALLRTRSGSQVREERARIMSLNNLLTTAGGFQMWLFEDMVMQTTDLLKDIADLMDDSIPAAEALVLQRLNDAEHSEAIVYHLRLLASSWLQAYPRDYEGFIPDGGGIDKYRKESIEPPNNEIDHLGMALLIDVLLKPIGISVEIVYLDRSAGTETNSHVMQAMDQDGQPAHTIHLLYRPSHYDILYKEPPSLQQVMGINPNIQVNRAANFTQPYQAQRAMNGFPSGDMALLAGMIPGFSFGPADYQSSYKPPLPTSVCSIVPTGPVSAPQSTISTLPSRSAFVSLNSPTSLASPILNSPHPFQTSAASLPLHTLPPPHPHSGIPAQLSPSAIPAPSFRPSKWEWAVAADLQEGPTPTFQTSTFKNSHYNTAHYNNPNFQPEEWSPDDEGLTSKTSGGPGGGGGGGHSGWGRKKSG